MTKLSWVRSHHVRVPRCAERAVDVLTLWSDFLRQQLGAWAPVWVIHPPDEGWADLLVGLPTSRQLSCVRVPPAELPLTTDIPYQVDDEFVDQVRSMIAEVGERSSSVAS